MTKYYSFDQKGFFTFETDAKNGTDGVPYLPAYATWTATPTIPTGKVAKYNAENDDWDLIDEKKKYIVDDNIVEVFYYQDVDTTGWTEYSDELWAPIELEKAKNSKIAQLKINREQENLKDYIVQAAELILQEDNTFSEGSQVDFLFVSKSTGNPATEPNNIITSTILNSLVNPAFFLPYSCRIITSFVQNNGISTNTPATTKKGYIKLNAAVATSISNHATLRNTNNIRITNQKEQEIQEATTLAEVEAIDITF